MEDRWVVFYNESGGHSAPVTRIFVRHDDGLYEPTVIQGTKEECVEIALDWAAHFADKGQSVQVNIQKAGKK